MHAVRQIALVAALAEHRHFGRAAQALGLTQPALTKALKALEDEAGAPLFDRGPPVALTGIGEIVLRHGQEILDQMAEMRREIALAQGLDTGKVAVAAGTHVADISVYQAVARLSRSHPMLSCALEVTDHLTIISGLQRGRFEVGVALVTEAEKYGELQIERLRCTPYRAFAAANHPLAGRNALSEDDLAAYPWIVPSGASRSLDLDDGAARPFGDPDPERGIVRTRLRVNTMDGIRQIVAGGHAIAAAPLAIIAEDVARGTVALLATDQPKTDLDYGFITRRGRSLSPGAEAFMAAVRAVEAEI